MNIRAKFSCQQIVTTDWGLSKQVKINFQALYDDKTEENRRFSKATPSGELWMIVDNPDVVKAFVPGKSYYLDFTPVEA